MKFIKTLIFMFFSLQLYAQNFSVGFQASPSFKLESIRNKATGLTTSISGYGFKVGLPIKNNLSNNQIFTTGLLYEFFAFDNRINNVLITSLRLNSVNLPLIYYYPLSDNFHLKMGGGLNYIFSSKQLSSNLWLNTSSLTRNFQPYLIAGISTNINGNNNNYELGFSANYNIFNIWKTSTLTTTHLVGFNLDLKYYF